MKTPLLSCMKPNRKCYNCRTGHCKTENSRTGQWSTGHWLKWRTDLL